MKKYIILFFIITLISNVFSQNQFKQDSLKIDSLKAQKKINRYKLFLNHSTTSTVFGRRDSIATPTLSPSFKYISHNNLFYQFSLFRTNTTDKAFDELDAKIGYRYFIGNWFDGSVSYTRFMFNKDVARLTSLINNDLNLYFGFDLNYIYSGLSIDFTSGRKRFWVKNKVTGKNNLITVKLKDVNYTWMNYRQFYIPTKKNTLIITPEIDFVFGTQNNIEVYRFGKLLNEESKSAVYLKAIYYNLDILYTIRKFSFNFSPYYMVPYHSEITNITSPYMVYYTSLIYTHKWEKKKKKNGSKKTI